MILFLALAGCVRPHEAPALSSLEPLLSCEAGTLSVGAEGVGPVVVDPLSERPDLLWPTLEAVQGERRVSLGTPEWIEGQAEVDLPALDAGSWDLVLVDPFGAESAMGFGVTGRPALTGVIPESICQELGVQQVRIEGTFLLADELPAVRIDGREQVVVAAEGCDDASPLRTCEALLVELDGSTALGLVDIEVEGPIEGCVSEDPLRVQVVPAPRITDIEGREVCDGGGTVVVVGEGFSADMEVLLDGAAADFSYLDAAHIEVTVPPMSEGSYSLELVHPNGCNAFDAEGVRVASAPIMFFVDPPRVWGGLQRQQVTAYIADVSDEITDVWVEDDQGTETAVDWFWDASEPGVLEATVPANALGAGNYTLGFSQGGDCAGEAGGPFEVRGGVTLDLVGVDPALAWAFDRTPIQIVADGGLVELPRVYLVNPVSGDTARLLGVHLLDDSTLTATVPEGLEEGSYHLLVYNPDNSFGRLLDAIEVTTDTPPRVDSVRPATLPRGGSVSFEVKGRGFRDAQVALDCQDGSSLQAAVTAESPTRLQVVADTGALSPTVCTVSVENADGTSAIFASVTVTNPSQNLFGWSAGPDLVEARRAPAATAVRANAINRYVLVLGGDEGDISTARDTVEVAPIGIYGHLGEFELLPSVLPRNRTLAQAVSIGPFVYLVGGSNGVKAGGAVYRARVLDPLDVPLVESVSMRSGGGVATGTWIYRVSALYPADDDANPGGESLASDPLAITLPFAGIQPSFSWTTMDGASGYRVYRSPSVDAPYGDEEWVADVTAPEFTDTGAATNNLVPLTVGALGEWANVDGLTVPREGACVTTVPDNSPDPEVVWILAAGGRDDDGNVLDTIEALEVRVEGARTQTTGTWTLLDATLTEGAWGCGAWSLDYRWHTVVDPGESWYYVGGGHTDNGIAGTIDAFRIGGSDLLTDQTTVDNLSPPRAGFVAASGSNFLYALGGQQGSPSDRGTSAKIETAPDFKNWNSLAKGLVEARYLPASTQESAVFLVIGGETDDEAATHSTEWTNY